MFNPFKKKTIGTQQTMKIKGMHCSSCAMLIDDSVEEIEGVISSDTSYAKGETKVEFNPDLVKHDQLVKAITNEGYEVVEK